MSDRYRLNITIEIEAESPAEAYERAAAVANHTLDGFDDVEVATISEPERDE